MQEQVEVEVENTAVLVLVLVLVSWTCCWCCTAFLLFLLRCACSLFFSLRQVLHSIYVYCLSLCIRLRNLCCLRKTGLDRVWPLRHTDFASYDMLCLSVV